MVQGRFPAGPPHWCSGAGQPAQRGRWSTARTAWPAASAVAGPWPAGPGATVLPAGQGCCPARCKPVRSLSATGLACRTCRAFARAAAFAYWPAQLADHAAAIAFVGKLVVGPPLAELAGVFAGIFTQ